MELDSRIFLSVIVPAFNEEKRIIPTLEKIDAFLSQQAYAAEVIVVDDHSRDKTYEAVQGFISGRANYRLYRNLRNEGKGASVKYGMMAAKGEFRLFSDADLSTPIEEVDKFFPLMRPAATRPPYDVVIGSRRVKGANVAKRQPILREGAGRVFSVLVRLLTIHGFLDTQCGFKMFTASAAENIFSRQTIRRFGFDVEILYIALNRFHYRVIETPVTWVDSPATRVRFFRDSTRMFLDLLRIPWRGWRGAYR